MQEMALPPPPAKGWSRAKITAVVVPPILCTKWRSASLGRSLGLRSGKGKMEKIVLLLLHVLSGVGKRSQRSRVTL